MPAAAMGLLLIAGASRPARAQVLNDEVTRLLSDQCAQLNIGSAGNLIGPGLSAICAAPPGAGSSSGNGSAAVQSSITSVQNSVLQHRLQRARKSRTASGWRGGGERMAWLSAARYTEFSLLAPAPEDGEDEQAGSGDFRSNRFDLFFSVGYENLDRDLTKFEDGYDSSIAGATFGLDYRFTDWVVAGLIVTYSKQDGDFDGGGDFETSSLLPTLYATFLPSDRSYIQVSVGQNFQDYDVRRKTSFLVDTGDPNNSPLFLGTPTSSADADVDLASLQLGYDFSAGRFTFGPRLSGNYSRTTVDAYSEDKGNGLGLSVEEQKVKSVQGIIGFSGSMAVSTKRGVFVPQASVEYVKEFEDDPTVIDARFAEDNRGPQATTFRYQTNTPDSSFFNVDVGFSAVLANGVSPYLSLRKMLGNDLFDSFAVNAGVRFEL